MFNPEIPLEWGSDWRDIKNYEGRFKISEKGVVISLPQFVNCTKGGIRFCPLYKMKPHKNELGYWIINLNKDYKNDLKYLHRLVAEAFIPNPDNLPYVNHKDENPENYSIDNLEWCTHEYNMNYGTRNQRLSKVLTDNPKLTKSVLQYDLEGNFIKEFSSFKDAVKEGFNSSSISNCCAGRCKTHKGFIWRYKIV